MGKEHAAMTREERLAAKLRENLRRRKAQARAMGGDASRADEAAPGGEARDDGPSQNGPQ
ncbi:MAG: hypothetical protein IE933_14230 [Sphingomonadales bacterium]|nr:hypothetical protein [Sphingomonadales bacterium]MBD3774249.1 hypothetical protein [Paracoccaceae bacterium]